MQDKSQPLTAAFYSEIGNPEEERYYRYIKSYCPYENIQPQRYPHLYVTTGLEDENVPYWGPLKWVAKLREMKRDNNLIMCNIRSEGGHICPSNLRGIKLCREMSKFYTFLLHAFRR
jgi:oligopeptidase B